MDMEKFKQAKIAKSTPNIVDERANKDSSLMMLTVTDTQTKEKRSPMATREPKSKQHQVQEALIAAASTAKTCKNQNKDQLINIAAEKEKTAASEKAAKIQRMKSGFRICKPHGTFLWPNMVKDNNIINSSNSSGSTQVMVQVEVPTPPSVNSSTALAPPQLLVKPLAEKRAVKVTVSTVSKDPNNYHEDGGNNYSNNAALINLNNAPEKPNDMPLVSANANTSQWESCAYGAFRNVMGMGYHQKENNNTTTTTMCCCPSDMSNWLALSTLNSASDESTHGC